VRVKSSGDDYDYASNASTYVQRSYTFQRGGVAVLAFNVEIMLSPEPAEKFP